MYPDAHPAACDGPPYALAIYDGDRHVGFLPWQGSTPVAESAGVPLDTFHSELGVRSQARLRALEFAPLTVVPYDLHKHCPLDSILTMEDRLVPVKDEEYRDISPCAPAVNAHGGRGAVDPAPKSNSPRKSPRRGNLDDLTSAVKSLAKTQRRLARIVARLVPDVEG